MALWLKNGTIAVTQGQTVVVGTGTTFKTALNPAQTGQPIIIRTAAGLDIYEIESIQDDTHLTLAEPVKAATAGSLAYIIPVTIQGSFAALANRAALVMSELNGLVKADQNLSELTQPDVALGHLGLSAFAIELVKLANAGDMANKLTVVPKTTTVNGHALSGNVIVDTHDVFSTAKALTTENLNTLIAAGIYTQVHAANATPANNYPLQKSCVLEVFNYSNCIQRITFYETGETYSRSLQNASPITWYPWVKTGSAIGTFGSTLMYQGTAATAMAALGAVSLTDDQTIDGIKSFRGKLQLDDGVSIVNKNGVQVVRPSGENATDTVIGSLSGRPFLYAKDGVAYIQDGPDHFLRIYYEGYKPTPEAIGAFDKDHTMGIASYDANINDIRTSGVYRLSEATQGPLPPGVPSFQGMMLEVFEWDSNAGNQVLYPYNGARPYYRNRQGTNWGQWRGFWQSSDFAFDSGNFTPLVTVEDVGTMPAPNNVGKYTRVGNLVTVSGVVYITDKGNWPKRMMIQGFPLGGIATGAGASSAVALTPFNMTCGGQITGTYGGGGGGIDLQFIPTGQALRNLTASDLTYVGPDLPLIQFHFSYFISSNT